MSAETVGPPILVVGLNYRSVPVEIRERLAFGPECAGSVLLEMLGKERGPEDFMSEAVLLSTCNRTEIYLHAANFPAVRKRVDEYLSNYAGLSSPAWRAIRYTLQGESAILHLMRVSTGLDSLVIGEQEILGQVRRASEIAYAAGTQGPVLAALFRSAIHAGKRARAETGLKAGALSVASVVVEMAGHRLGSLHERTALLIGAGKISSMTARALAGAGLRWILIANRTFERAEKMARDLNGQAVHFDSLDESLVKADIVICSTGAPHLVLHAETVRKAQQVRNYRPLLIADLAVPRDADPAIASIPGVQLVNIDDLESIMKQHHLPVDEVCKQVEQVIRQEAAAFCSWYSSRRCAPLIQAMNQRAEQIYMAQVERTLSRMGPLTPHQQRLVKAMAKAIAAKIMHDPVTRLREMSGNRDISSLIELAKDLYRLP